MTPTVSKLAPRGDYEFLIPSNAAWASDEVSAIPHEGALLDAGAELAVHLVRDHEGTELAASDFPWLKSRIPTFTRRALAMLRPFLERHGQILALTAPEATYYGLNVTTVVDALDLAESDIEYFDDGSVLTINRPAFRDDVLLPAIFVLSDFDRASSVYVTDEYIDTLAATGLPGAAFRKVWPLDR